MAPVDYSTMSNEELMRIAGITATPIPSGDNPYSSMSNEELMKIAGITEKPSTLTNWGQSFAKGAASLGDMGQQFAKAVMPGGRVLEALGLFDKSATQRAQETFGSPDYSQAGFPERAVGAVAEALPFSFMGGVGPTILGALGGETTNTLTGYRLPGEILGGAIPRTSKYLGSKLSKWGGEFDRKSIGISYGDYKKTLNDMQAVDVPEGGIESLTKKATSNFLQKHSKELDLTRDPVDLLSITDKEASKISLNIGGLIKKYDSIKQSPVEVPFTRAQNFINSGKVPANKVEAYRKELDALREGIQKEGLGSLEYVQQQKIALGKSWDTNDGVKNDFIREVYSDLQKTIESKVPEVRQLNQQLQEYKILEPIFRRNLAVQEATDPVSRAISTIRTTGGVGGPLIASGMFFGPLGYLAGGAAGLMFKNVNSKAALATGSNMGSKIATALGNTATDYSIPLSTISSSLRAQQKKQNEEGSEGQKTSKLSLKKKGNDPEFYPSEASLLTSKQQELTEQQKYLQPSVGNFLSSTYSPDNTKSFLKSTQGSKAPKELQSSAKQRFPENAQRATLSNPASYTDPNQVKKLMEQQHPLIRAVAQVESGGNPRAVSPAGAQGLMQLMPGTAKEVGVKNAFNPEESIQGGTQYLIQNLEKFKDVNFALAGYNAGPARVDKAIKATIKAGERVTWVNIQKRLPQETRDYVRKVKSIYTRYI